MPTLYEWPAATVRSGRRFEPVAEKALDSDLRALAARFRSTDQVVHSIPEFPGANGIADLLVVSSVGSRLHARLSSGLPFLRSLTDARVAAAIPRGRDLDWRRLAPIVDMSERQVGSTLNRLVSAGVVIRHGGLVRRNIAMAPVGRMYALEAKVSDWRKGMSQALRYSTWSDAAGVVLAEAPQNIEQAKLRARTLGLGLAVRDRWIVRPRLKVPQAGLRLLASEHFVMSLHAAGYPSLPEPFGNSVTFENLQVGLGPRISVGDANRGT